MRRFEKTAALALVASVLAAGCGDGDATIELTSPSSGTVWGVDAAGDVTWTAAGLKAVRIEFTRDGTWADVEVIGVADAVNGVFAWNVTGPATASAQCRVRVRDAFLGTPSSESEDFTIATVGLTSPNDGDLWKVGLPATIDWSAIGLAQVDVELSRDGNWLDGDGSDVETVAGPLAAGVGTYTWDPVTGPESDSCLVRVVDSGGSGAGATSWAAIRIWGRAWKVVEGAPAGGDGRFWSTAFNHPQEGVDAAFASADAKVVWVAGGDYYGTATPVLALADGVAVYGGFAGGETALGDRNVTANVTTLDGEGLYRVVLGAPSARLDGFTVTDGNAGLGGGMYSDTCANLTVANCAFVGNNAVSGAGMASESCPNLTVADCTFVGNQASIVSGIGGGMYADACPVLEVTRCVFEMNSADLGGASYTRSGYLYLTNCVYWQNTATTRGGAVYILDHDTTIRHCTFNGNQAGEGGAIFEFDNILVDEIQVVENSILWGNAAGTDKDIGKGGAMGGLPLPTYTDIEQDGFAGGGNIKIDPDFEDPATGDLHLRTSPLSPCIDAGAVLAPAVTDDLDGEARPQGGAPDMGAYEDG